MKFLFEKDKIVVEFKSEKFLSLKKKHVIFI